MKELVLGICLNEKTIQAVEIEQDGPVNTLLAIDEWENTLLPSPSANGEGMKRFVETLNNFIELNQVQASEVSVTLDSSLLFVNTVPMDDRLSHAEVKDHIAWELNQYFPESSSEEFVTDTHQLTETKTDGWTDLLAIALSRIDLKRMQRAVTEAGLSIGIVDVDHFSADTALRVNYPDIVRRYLALVGLKENRLDVSMLKYGILEKYSYYAVQSDKEIIEILSDISRNTKGLYSLTAYGSYLDKDLLSHIRAASSLLVEALNPLRHVRVSDDLHISNRLSSPSYRFAAAVGVALRRE